MIFFALDFDLLRENMLCTWQLSIKHTMEISKKREENLIKKTLNYVLNKHIDFSSSISKSEIRKYGQEKLHNLIFICMCVRVCVCAFTCREVELSFLKSSAEEEKNIKIVLFKF